MLFLFNHLVMSNSLRLHRQQNAKLPVLHCLPELAQFSYPFSQWCYLPILSCASPLLLLPSVFPSIRVFSSESVLYIRWPKYWSFSISPSNEHSALIYFNTGLIFLQFKGLSIVFSNTTVQKHQFFSTQPPLWSNSHIHTWLLEKP